MYINCDNILGHCNININNTNFTNNQGTNIANNIFSKSYITFDNSKKVSSDDFIT